MTALDEKLAELKAERVVLDAHLFAVRSAESALEHTQEYLALENAKNTLRTAKQRIAELEVEVHALAVQPARA